VSLSYRNVTLYTLCSNELDFTRFRLTNCSRKFKSLVRVRLSFVCVCVSVFVCVFVCLFVCLCARVCVCVTATDMEQTSLFQVWSRTLRAARIRTRATGICLLRLCPVSNLLPATRNTACLLCIIEEHNNREARANISLQNFVKLL
jgi:hypothetical protein